MRNFSDREQRTRRSATRGSDPGQNVAQVRSGRLPGLQSLLVAHQRHHVQGRVPPVPGVILDPGRDPAHAAALVAKCSTERNSNSRVECQASMTRIVQGPGPAHRLGDGPFFMTSRRRLQRRTARQVLTTRFGFRSGSDSPGAGADLRGKSGHHSSGSVN